MYENNGKNKTGSEVQVLCWHVCFFSQPLAQRKHAKHWAWGGSVDCPCRVRCVCGRGHRNTLDGVAGPGQDWALLSTISLESDHHCEIRLWSNVPKFPGHRTNLNLQLKMKHLPKIKSLNIRKYCHIGTNYCHCFLMRMSDSNIQFTFVFSPWFPK